VSKPASSLTVREWYRLLCRHGAETRWGRLGLLKWAIELRWESRRLRKERRG